MYLGAMVVCGRLTYIIYVNQMSDGVEFNACLEDTEEYVSLWYPALRVLGFYCWRGLGNGKLKKGNSTYDGALRNATETPRKQPLTTMA